MMQLEYCETVPKQIASLRTQAKTLLKQEISFVDNREFRSADVFLSIESAIAIAGERRIHDGSTLPNPGPLYRVCQQPLLSKPQERTLFFAMNALKFRANSLRASLDLANLNSTSVDDCNRFLRDAQDIRDTIISSNVRLVLAIVRDFHCSYLSHDELASDGIEALIRAVEKFDFDRGFRFSTYATTVISRHFGRIAKLESKRRTRFASAMPEVLDTSHTNEETNVALETATSSSMSGLLQSMMQSLDERERLILRRRFGFEACDTKPTLSSIAAEFGVCKERVRQIESRALRKMRRMCNERMSNEVKADLTADVKA